jgi:hypothetical protein
VEWPRLQALGHPIFAERLPDPRATQILVAEDAEGAIIGYALAYQCVHLEPIWVQEEYRRKPGVVRRLWKGAAQMLQRAGITWAFATIAIQDAPSNQALAQHLGFTRLAADLYFLEIPPASAILPEELASDAGQAPLVLQE